MKIASLALTHFRCFEQLAISFDAPVTLIEGCNGSGKTSILEALHYACFMRSFRALSPTQMIRFGQSAFSVKIQGISDEEPWQLVVGASAEQRSAKINGKSVTGHTQILERYRSLTITEDDLDLITGYPENRRHFLDTILFLLDPEHSKKVRAYNQTLKQRTALLFQPRLDHEAFAIWTENLTALSLQLQEQRRTLLQQVTERVQHLVHEYCLQVPTHINFTYQAREADNNILQREIETRRTLFGAHLDDIVILYGNNQARRYASRGQQKMLIMLMKLAALQIINQPTLLLLDDVMTDFDRTKLEQIIDAFAAQKAQMVITCPMEKSAVSEILQNYQAHKIALNPNIHIVPPNVVLPEENIV